MRNAEPITEIVDTLEDATREKNACLGDILGSFGAAAFSPCLLTVSLFLVSPLSGIPLFSSLCGILIFLISVQGAWGRKRIWVPRRLGAIEIDSDRSEWTLRKARRAAEWIDKHSHNRLLVLVTPPASRVLYSFCAVLGLILPFLEIVPMSSSLIGGVVALIATGLLTRDGVISLIGLLALPLAALPPVAAYSALLGG
ncbi:exopolysaccharide biosynthesis protein [Cognatishimia sp. MH4019]|uniref:exopolysaccharide biosynthesis protein n=1 Tax=Cognatishimia sp. MH4019 TaxID=2854030 RepID=UPI001CD478AA|nr:exopolysaccharide biosynthesis protein [Cognatishimia sp. MH4019]